MEDEKKMIMEMNEPFFEETNIITYFMGLSEFLEDFIVFLAVSDTAGGHYFTEEYGAIVQEGIRTRTNLYNCYRRPYIAIIDHGVCVFEELGEDRTKPLDIEGTINNGHTFHIRSEGYECGNRGVAMIALDGIDYATDCRGINIVVYDDAADCVVDACSFDTYKNLRCRREHGKHNFYLPPFVRQHPDVKVASISFPKMILGEMTNYEKFLFDNDIHFSTLSNNIDELLARGLVSLPAFFDNKEEMLAAFTPPSSYEDLKGVRHFYNKSLPGLTMRNGLRVTYNQPKSPKHAIFLVGDSRFLSMGADDGRTIPSFLQNMCNKISDEWIVHNYGFLLLGGGFREFRRKRERLLASVPAKAGDIVIVEGTPMSGISHLDLSQAFRRPHDYGEVFCDMGHFTPNGNRVIAERLFAFIQESGDWKDPLRLVFPDEEKAAGYRALFHYKEEMRARYDTFAPVVGSIVMNCNPFTLGHLHLVRQAAAQVDKLIIFVVEEDRSFFPFADRLRLVRENLVDIPNVEIVPSGEYVLSAKTFEGYFNKESLQDQPVDASQDVRIFATEIAPCLHIRKRFVGEEPFDTVTRQYNETMKEILPTYGIELIEIPRKAINGAAISASKVRALLEKQDFAAIKSLVPEATYRYLKNFKKTYKNKGKAIVI